MGGRYEEYLDHKIRLSDAARVYKGAVHTRLYVRGVSIGKINDATVCTLLSIGITYQLRSDMLQRC